jgi:hypothetical protein
MLPANVQDIYRGGFTHDDIRHGFGTLHDKITPFYEDTHVDYWTQNQFDGHGTNFYSNVAFYIRYSVNGDISG